MADIKAGDVRWKAVLDTCAWKRNGPSIVLSAAIANGGGRLMVRFTDKSDGWPMAWDGRQMTVSSWEASPESKADALSVFAACSRNKAKVLLEEARLLEAAAVKAEELAASGELGDALTESFPIGVKVSEGEDDD